MGTIDKSTSQVLTRTCKTYTPNGVTERSGSTTISLPVSRTGYVKDNWRTIIASGGNATTDFTGVEVKLLSLKPYSVTVQSFNDKRYYSTENGSAIYNFIPQPAPVASELPKLSSQAASQAYGRIRSGFNTSSFIGELVEVKKMLLNPANGLIKGYEAYLREAKYLRQRIRKLGDLRRAFASLYLEYNFGWVPLYRDIQSAVQAYNDVLADKKTLRVSGQSKTKISTVVGDGWNTLGSYTAKMTSLDQVNTEVSVRWIGAIRFDTPGSVSFNFGAGLGDFVPGIWNLLPWSFVVDYFVNIGDILDANAIASNVTWQYACSIERIIARHNCVVSAAPFLSSEPITSFTAGGYTAEAKSVKRRTATAISVPTLHAKVPSLKQGLNLFALAAAFGWHGAYVPPSTYTD